MNEICFYMKLYVSSSTLLEIVISYIILPVIISGCIHTNSFL